MNKATQVHSVLIPTDEEFGGVSQQVVLFHGEDFITIKGYAATWDIDLQGDQVARGAFKASLAAMLGARLAVPMFVDHQYQVCVGVFEIEHMLEDDKGLWVEGKINRQLGVSPLISKLLRERVLIGLSYGGLIDNLVHLNGVRVFTELTLMEISITADPQNTDSLISVISD